jgi:Family of unknown function (DUF6049)
VRRGVLAALAVLLAVPAGLAPPGRARAQQAAPALEVVLVSISPMVGPSTRLAYQVEVRNRGQVPLRDLRVQVGVGRPVATRSELAGLLAAPGGPTQGLAGLDSFTPAGAEVAPGATLRLERRRVAVPPELGAGSAGAVLPLSVLIQASGPGLLTARIGTFAIWLPARPDRPLRAALLVPFHEPPHRNSSGEFVDEGLAELLGPGGPLGAAAAVLARPGAPRLTMVVDGLLVEEATAMAGSWRLRQRGTSTVVPAGDPRSRDASRFLQDLKEAARVNQPAAFPYADADLPALVRNRSDGQAALQVGRTALRAELGTPPDQRLAWPVDGAIDAAVLQALAAGGADTVVLDPHRLPTPASATITQNTTVDLGEGMLQRQRALVGDPALSAALTDPRAASAPAEWAQRILAETAVAWLERPNASEPRGILLAPPHGWRPPPAFFRALARGLAAAPWLRVQRASTLADDVAQGPDKGERRLATVTAADVDAGLPDTYLDRVVQVRSQLASFRGSVGPGFQAAGHFDRDLLIAESSDWRPATARTRGRAFVRAVQRGMAGVYRRVHVESTRVTLTARRGNIPITVRNDSAQPITVVLRLSSPKVDLPQRSSEPFVLEPRRRSTQVLSVGTRTTGSFPIRVDVLTSDGAEGIAHGEVVLVSTAFNRVALVLSGGAAGFLLLWWRRGRRRTREAAA